MNKINRNNGFTIIEIVITILIIGVIATVAVRKAEQSITTAKYEQTKKEMNQLEFALVGNPSVYEHGRRANFGYVGDIGALPPSLDALISNPGGYATWNGPYIDAGINGDEFKTDGWGQTYQIVGNLIRSTGSGSNIDKSFTNSISSLIANTVIGTITDANQSLPGAVYKDSLELQLIYPNGAGGTATATTYPDQSGRFQFSMIPIGNHILKSIYIPLNDTASQIVSVLPGKTVRQSILYPIDLW